MKLILPKNIADIITSINNSGFEAHIVGGCVRDMLINKTPTDWDITTNASPNTIKSMFPKTIDTGIKHGTVTVLYNGISVEVTTWRKETSYSDHRRPDRICLTDSLTEDLARRDFTMNAIAYHPKEGLVDPFGGVTDISNRIIRCVGNPFERFSEDALRMLRAIRFSAQLDFSIDKCTFSSINQLSGDLIHISKERIQSEINKILESKFPQKISLLWDSGLSKIIFPGVEKLPSNWFETIKHFIGSENQKIINLSLIFYISCKEDELSCAKQYLTLNKYDGKTRRGVVNHIKCLNGIGPLTPRNIRKSVSEYGVSVTANTMKILNILQSINKNKTLYAYGEVKTAPIIPAISGSDLIELGFEGRAIKDMLNIILLCLYENPSLNNKELLILLVKSIMASIRFFCK